MAEVRIQETGSDQLVSGQRLQLPEETGVVVADAVVPRSNGVDLYVTDDASSGKVRKVSLTSAQAQLVKVVTYAHVEQDGCSIRLFLQEGTDPKYTVARCPSHCPRHPYQILTFPDIQNRIHQERRAACPFENHAYRNLVAL